MEYTEVTPEEFGELDGLDDWRVALDAIHTTFTDAGLPRRCRTRDVDR